MLCLSYICHNHCHGCHHRHDGDHNSVTMLIMIILTIPTPIIIDLQILPARHTLDRNPDFLKRLKEILIFYASPTTFTHRHQQLNIKSSRFVFFFKQQLRVNGAGVVKITRFILNPPLWWSLNGLQTMEGDVVEIFIAKKSILQKMQHIH